MDERVRRMEELGRVFDDALNHLSDARRYLVRLGWSDRQRDALDLGKQPVLYSVTVSCSARKVEEAMSTAGSAIQNGWKIPDNTAEHVEQTIKTFSRAILKINR